MANLKSATKQVTLVIGCLEHTVFTPIQYQSFNSSEIYIFGRAALLLSYIESILRKHAADHVTVLLIHGDTASLIDTLSVLRTVSESLNLDHARESYMAHYEKQMAIVSGSNYTKKTLLKLPKGHNDVPLAFRLAIVQQCDDFERLDHLSERNVSIQQILRFLALTHGGIYAAVSGLTSIARDSQKLSSFASDLVNNSIDPEMLIYSVNGAKWAAGVEIHQSTPPGWDSWSKIELSAKTITRDSGREMLDSEESLNVLYNAYTNYCAHNGAEEKNQLWGILRKYVEFAEKKAETEKTALLGYKDTLSIFS